MVYKRGGPNDGVWHDTCVHCDLKWRTIIDLRARVAELAAQLAAVKAARESLASAGDEDELIDAWEELDRALAGAEVLAVVDGHLWFDGEASRQVASIEARLPGHASDWPDDVGYRVTVTRRKEG